MAGITNALNVVRKYHTMKIIVQLDVKNPLIIKKMKNFEKREKKLIKSLNYGATFGLGLMTICLVVLFIRNLFF